MKHSLLCLAVMLCAGPGWAAQMEKVVSAYEAVQSSGAYKHEPVPVCGSTETAIKSGEFTWWWKGFNDERDYQPPQSQLFEWVGVDKIRCGVYETLEVWRKFKKVPYRIDWIGTYIVSDVEVGLREDGMIVGRRKRP